MNKVAKSFLKQLKQTQKQLGLKNKPPKIVTNKKGTLLTWNNNKFGGEDDFEIEMMFYNNDFRTSFELGEFNTLMFRRGSHYFETFTLESLCRTINELQN